MKVRCCSTDPVMLGVIPDASTPAPKGLCTLKTDPGMEIMTRFSSDDNRPAPSGYILPTSRPPSSGIRSDQTPVYPRVLRTGTRLFTAWLGWHLEFLGQLDLDREPRYGDWGYVIAVVVVTVGP
jgi:hypothetical protein